MRRQWDDERVLDERSLGNLLKAKSPLPGATVWWNTAARGTLPSDAKKKTRGRRKNDDHGASRVVNDGLRQLAAAHHLNMPDFGAYFRSDGRSRRGGESFRATVDKACSLSGVLLIERHLVDR